jgi:hypothetical protein
VARKKGITVREDYGPGTRVVGDQQALEQATLIILENAVKYTPPGGTVTIRALATDDHVNLVVEDTGIGIPAEHLPRGASDSTGGPCAVTRRRDAGLGLAVPSDRFGTRDRYASPTPKSGHTGDAAITAPRTDRQSGTPHTPAEFIGPPTCVWGREVKFDRNSLTMGRIYLRSKAHARGNLQPRSPREDSSPVP